MKNTRQIQRALNDYLLDSGNSAASFAVIIDVSNATTARWVNFLIVKKLNIFLPAMPNLIYFIVQIGFGAKRCGTEQAKELKRFSKIGDILQYKERKS